MEKRKQIRGKEAKGSRNKIDKIVWKNRCFQRFFMDKKKHFMIFRYPFLKRYLQTHRFDRILMADVFTGCRLKVHVLFQSLVFDFKDLAACFIHNKSLKAN